MSGPGNKPAKTNGVQVFSWVTNWTEPNRRPKTRPQVGYPDPLLTVVLSDDVAVSRCAWPSIGWYCDGKRYCWGIVCCREEVDACYPDQTWRSSAAWGAPDAIDCKAFDDKEVVGIQTCQWKTNWSRADRQCAPHWSRMDWGHAGKTENSCWEIHFMVCFRNMEGSLMAASMFLVSAGKHQGW